MRLKVQYATREHIIGEGAVREFLGLCLDSLGLGIGFHPDTRFEDYIFKDGKRKNKPCFTKEEAEELNKTLEECFDQCKKLKLDIYAIALEIMEPLIKKAFNE